MVDEKNIFDVMKQPTVTILEELSKMDTLDVDCKNEVGQSPLHLAVLNNQLSVAAYLLNKGFSPNKKDENLLPPFIAAAANGLTDMFELLLTFSPDLKQVNRFGGTALLPSSEKGFIQVVQKALDAGVPVNHVNRLGWSALLEAVVLGNEGFLFRDIVSELMSHGADALIKDFDGKTAIEYGTERHSQIILPLLEGSVTESEFDGIKGMIRKGNYYQAIHDLLVLPETAEQLYYLGTCYDALGEDEISGFYYEKGYQLDSQFAYYLANLKKKYGESESAIEWFNKGSQTSETPVFFDYHLSNYLRELGRHEAAVDMMDKLLETDAKRVDYLFHKANSLRSLGRHQAAYDAMILASQLQPENQLFAEHAAQSKEKID